MCRPQASVRCDSLSYPPIPIPKFFPCGGCQQLEGVGGRPLRRRPRYRHCQWQLYSRSLHHFANGHAYGRDRDFDHTYHDQPQTRRRLAIHDADHDHSDRDSDAEDDDGDDTAARRTRMPPTTNAMATARAELTSTAARTTMTIATEMVTMMVAAMEVPTEG